VASTGAVLSAGEELRPTGTDRGLLTRVAEITGGQVRDTMAGIFKERSAKRFAYESLASPLLLFAALALLLGVAGRKLALPERVSALPSRLRSRLRAREERRARAGAARADEPPAATSTLQALKDRKHERSGDLPRPPVVSDAPPPSVPRFAELAPRPAPRSAASPQAGPVGPGAPPPATQGGPASSRQMSAAEILLARRRGRR
jgi:hypothetical protein